jgi:hypothetical protein
MYRRWTEFQGVPNKFRNDQPHVTLSAKGVILMNQIAFESFGSPENVTLLFDKANAVIGLKPCEPGTANAFPAKPKDKNRNRVIHGKPFLRHFGIEADRTLLFNNVTTEDGILLLDLANVTTVSSVGRKIG